MLDPPTHNRPFANKRDKVGMDGVPKKVKDAIHTHFVTLIGKWTIVGGWVKHQADKRDKVGKIKS